jgi:hypothetical protein
METIRVQSAPGRRNESEKARRRCRSTIRTRRPRGAPRRRRVDVSGRRRKDLPDPRQTPGGSQCVHCRLRRCARKLNRSADTVVYSGAAREPHSVVVKASPLDPNQAGFCSGPVSFHLLTSSRAATAYPRRATQSEPPIRAPSSEIALKSCCVFRCRRTTPTKTRYDHWRHRRVRSARGGTTCRQTAVRPSA